VKSKKRKAQKPKLTRLQRRLIFTRLEGVFRMTARDLGLPDLSDAELDDFVECFLDCMVGDGPFAFRDWRSA
jgi:hypothetical protein